MTFFIIPTLTASRTASAKEATLAALARLANVPAPVADTSALDSILAAPTAREVMLHSARTGTHDSEALAAAVAHDSVRDDVPRMREQLTAESHDERRESIRPAVEAVFDDAAEALAQAATALDESKPLDTAKAFEANVVGDWHVATKALAILAEASAINGYPDGATGYERIVKTVAMIAEVDDVERYGEDEVTLGVRTLAWDLSREGDLDKAIVDIARGVYTGVRLRLSPNRVETLTRARRIHEAGIIADPLRDYRRESSHPKVRNFQ